MALAQSPHRERIPGFPGSHFICRIFLAYGFRYIPQMSDLSLAQMG